MKIITAPQFGPMFRFNDANVYWALYILSSGKRIGRKRLADEVGVGEGSIRRIIETLKERDYISISQTGIVITDAGNDFLDSLPMRPVDIFIENSVMGTNQQGVIVKGVASKIKNGMEQRDAGIRVGAAGCTTIVYRGDDLCIPPDWNVDKERPDIAKRIREEFKLEKNDILIIGGGNSQPIAIEAALTAALELF